MPRRLAILAAALPATILLATPALAQTSPEPGAAEDLNDPRLYADWTIRFEPSTWFVSPGGRIEFRGQPDAAPELWLSDLNLDSPRLSPFGELHLRATEVWRFVLSGFALSLEDRGSTAEFDYFLGSNAVNTGDRINSSLSFTSGEFLAAWRLPYELGKKFDDFEGRIELLGGARFIHLDYDIEGPAFSLSEEQFFLQPMIGARINMEITQQFSIDVQNSFGYFNDGGDHSSFTWDIIAGFMYYPTENLGVQIGYRQLFHRLRDGEGSDRFEWNGANAGIYGGVTLRF